MAACYLKLEDWKASVDAATACIDCLDRVISPSTAEETEGTKQKKQDPEPTDEVVEISGDDEEAEQKELQRLQDRDKRKQDVLRIRAKALMRRARAKSQLGGWGNLQGAEEDYKLLDGLDNLPPEDKRVVQRALRELPEKINKARETEMADMMGKLKDVSSCQRFFTMIRANPIYSWEMAFSSHLGCPRTTSSLPKTRRLVDTT